MQDVGHFGRKLLTPAGAENPCTGSPHHPTDSRHCRLGTAFVIPGGDLHPAVHSHQLWIHILSDCRGSKGEEVVWGEEVSGGDLEVVDHSTRVLCDVWWSLWKCTGRLLLVLLALVT